MNSFNGSTTVVLRYKSDFEKGSADETFNYQISGSAAVLQGYNINSAALIIN